MTFRFRLSANARPTVALNGAVIALAVLAAAPSMTQAATYPITPGERSTAQQVASRRGGDDHDVVVRAGVNAIHA